MRRHWLGIVALLALTVLVFTAAVIVESIYFGIVALLLGLLLLFIMGTAWIRPPGHSTEHHARHDRLVNDQRP